jgi:3-oxoadipate enol-lactonase
MTFLEGGDFRLHYLLEGVAGRPVVVLANSLGADLSMWDPQIAVLQRHFRVLRFDARGHGQSAIPMRPFGIEDAALDVIALLDYLQIREACFCGLSMGGMLGQWLALHVAERFRGFVLCNTAAKIGTAEIWNQRIGVVSSQGMEVIVPGILERWFTVGFRERSPQVLERTRGMLLATDPAGYVMNCAAIRDADFRDEIAKIKAPVLIVYGAEDPVTTSAEANYLSERISNASTLRLEAAHLSNVEAAEAFSRGVLQFLLKCYGEESNG